VEEFQSVIGDILIDCERDMKGNISWGFILEKYIILMVAGMEKIFTLPLIGRCTSRIAMVVRVMTILGVT
jgi:hypothetical protein